MGKIEMELIAKAYGAESSAANSSHGIIPIAAGRYLKLPHKISGRDRSSLDDWGLVRLFLAEQHGYALMSFITVNSKERDHHIYEFFTKKTCEWKQTDESKLGQFAIIQLGKNHYIFGIDLGDFRFLVQTQAGAKFFKPDPESLIIFKYIGEE